MQNDNDDYFIITIISNQIDISNLFPPFPIFKNSAMFVTNVFVVWWSMSSNGFGLFYVIFKNLWGDKH